MTRKQIKRFFRASIFVCGAFAFGLVPTMTAAEQKIYWSANGDIQRANLDGSVIENVIVGLKASALDFDEVEGRVYWIDSVNLKIQRANKDGTNVEDLVTTGLTVPRGIDVDEVGRKLYWTDRTSNGNIKRSDLDGSNVVTILNTNRPQGIEVDPASGRIYWSEDIPGRIRRMNLDGSGVETLVSGGDPEDIALDKANGKIYWTQNAFDMIQRANLDGTNVETLVNAEPGAPFGIDVDPVEEKVYWTNNVTGKIRRADLNGTNVEDIVTDLAALSWLTIDSAALTAFAEFSPDLSLLHFRTEDPEQTGGAAMTCPHSGDACVERTGKDTVQLKGSFVLDEDSDYIDPISEDVTVMVGSYAIVIPAGSFVMAHDGYHYRGTIDNAQVVVRFSYGWPYRYGFFVRIKHIDLAGTTNPVTLGLAIGNDRGEVEKRLQGVLK